MGSPFTPIHSPQLHSRICYIWHKHSIATDYLSCSHLSPCDLGLMRVQGEGNFGHQVLPSPCWGYIGCPVNVCPTYKCPSANFIFLCLFQCAQSFRTPLLPNRKPQISHSYSSPLQRAKREPSQTKIIQMNLAERNLSSTQVVTFIKNYY